MATRVAEAKAADEILFQNDGVALCLLVNRRQRTLRVIDFRSGPHPAKRNFVMSLARREGVERVFTLVERDECSTWTRLGFRREGSIPGFYKRSDAFILGADVITGEGDADSEQSGLRPAYSDSAPESDGERAYQQARKHWKGLALETLPPVRVAEARPADVTKALSAAGRQGRALTGFEPFGRDVQRWFFCCTARGGFSLTASVETQPCFDNAYLELLTGPRTEKETRLVVSAVHKLCDELLKREIVGCFALAATDDLDLGAVFLANGFRKTGLLPRHLLRGKTRVDAFLWSRKLALPADG
ncbi:MAG: hypothetical protein R3B13_21075 [Polyangiaceae bacterium]